LTEANRLDNPRACRSLRNLAAYTKDAAWVAREEAIDGSIEIGKAADLIVLDRNLFEVDVMALHKVRVLLTLLDGEPVYRDAHFAWH